MDAIPTTHDAARRDGQAQLAGERQNRMVVALFLLLVLVLIEPLVCVTYCRSYTQLRVHGAFAAQHQPHDLALHTGMENELAGFRPVLLSNLFVCFPHADHDAPFDLPSGGLPLPLHAHQAIGVSIILFVLVLIVRRHPLPPSHSPPHHAIRPPLRPPIARAL